jgi:hypothetical protein
MLAMVTCSFHDQVEIHTLLHSVLFLFVSQSRGLCFHFGPFPECLLQKEVVLLAQVLKLSQARAQEHGKRPFH